MKIYTMIPTSEYSRLVSVGFCSIRHGGLSVLDEIADLCTIDGIQIVTNGMRTKRSHTRISLGEQVSSVFPHFLLRANSSIHSST